MTIILRVYRDRDAFYPTGRFRNFIGEQLVMHDYETISVMVGTYQQNDTHNIEQGQALEDGDPRGKKLLRFTYKLNNDEEIWADTTKEKYLAAVDENQPRPGDVIINVPTPETAVVVEHNKAWIATHDHTSTVIAGIGAEDATTPFIEMNGQALDEYELGTPFSEDMLPLPEGKFYKIDKDTDTVYWGEPWYDGTRLFIRSNKNLVIATP
jgi:hypothetical protein